MWKGELSLPLSIEFQGQLSIIARVLDVWDLENVGLSPLAHSARRLPVSYAVWTIGIRQWNERTCIEEKQGLWESTNVSSVKFWCFSLHFYFCHPSWINASSETFFFFFFPTLAAAILSDVSRNSLRVNFLVTKVISVNSRSTCLSLMKQKSLR